MLKTIIKRDGTTEDFTPTKLIKWAQWASKHLGDRVNWSEIVVDTVAGCGESISSQDLQMALVKTCALKHDWAHNLMAGRLYSAFVHKLVYPGEIPTVKEQFTKMVELGLMKDMGYTDAEYEQMNSIVDHSKDFKYAYFQVEHIFKKYGLQNRVTKKFEETPQNTFMRMAAGISYKRPDRMKDFSKLYTLLSNNDINAPTPNYLNLGTPHNGLASCCLYYTDDTIASLNAGNTIAYVMTAQSAGIGGFINTRSIGDPVRNGSILHQGRLAYYKNVAGEVTANIQAGRGGACTQYYSAFDPEATTIAMLQNEMSPDSKRNRDIHFAVETNRLLARKVAAKQDVFSFNIKTAPDLMEAFFSGDADHFEALYNKYEADPTFKKVYTPAVDLVTMFYNQHNEVGTHYEFKVDEANRHTPFLDPIHSSNLCVAPETPILTKEYGYKSIVEMNGKEVHVWNGEEWSKVLVMQTSDASELYTVTFNGNKEYSHIDATAYHKWYIQECGGDGIETTVVVKRTHELQPGDKLIKFKLPNDTQKNSEYVTISDVMFTGRVDKTYCFKEPLRSMGVFAGVLIGNCTEITEPTAAYETVFDLDCDYDPGFIKFSYKTTVVDGSEGVFTTQIPYTEKVDVKNSFPKQAGFLKVGDVIINSDKHEWTVTDIHKVKISPEVAMCSLGGINVANECTDEEYLERCKYSLIMIDECIHTSDYPLKHIGYTAKNRLNAAVGIIGLATYLARRNLKYSSKRGKEEIHRVFERHAYFCIKASLELSKELGVAPWMHKTKWPQGWLPIDTYKKSVDEIVQVDYVYDWESLRAEIIANGGIRNSALIAHMPTESSSKGAGVPNSLLPVRDLYLKKKDQNLTVDWVAVDSDLIGSQYEFAYDISIIDQIHVYAIAQKFTDQTISADSYRDRVKNPKLYQSDLIDQFLLSTKYGMKSWYYGNSKTSDSGEEVSDKGCAGGACTL